MPAYTYTCPGCHTEKRTLQKGTYVCECGQTYERNNQGASAQILEKIDQGRSTKIVERLQDAVELTRDRAKSTKRFEP